MKKVVVLVLVIALVAGMSISLAEQKQKFDHKVLSKLDGYKYDKFDKDWSYYGAYLKWYINGDFVIGIKASGSVDEVDCIMLYASMQDRSGRAFANLREIQILADDVLIVCPLTVMDNESVTAIVPSYKEVLKHIGSAKEISFKVTTEMFNSFTFEPSTDEVKKLQTAANNMYKYSLVDYVNAESWMNSWFTNDITISVE